MEEVILVDAKDNETGTMEKLAAHQKGLLHRAFSVLVFNTKGELLLQKRAGNKYHSGELWSNTCCSHPRPGESTQEAAERRLMEEMGIDLRPSFLYKFIYKVELDNKLTEHEFDHVFTGFFDGEPVVNPHEVEDWKYVDLHDLKRDMSSNPDRYTSWLHMIIQNIGHHIKNYSL
ncbi:Isopentenyl-diphosphate delta-isomerase [Fulvivirga imtechensis AK7]|uniref:Isopentenyl-diphosphate delta-isomerase n=1 Tax=Fulvivirga imtechensis AK7 TaxID=1237149 RepID=L8JQZ9_9BACT|nr:isopentenyl-diphosphate Delta-isomerase [Fulvivirga imtechensis]ELR70638.1 Isopentenyl-diphosphate delta-isomerase [Fulvivirga imtechensis AK7]